MLVNIYGSKELFVTEYRTLLAERLLALTDFNTDKEVRNLELLKLRFGEDQMHMCEIMLKDIAESKRLGLLISEQLDDIGLVSTLVEEKKKRRRRRRGEGGKKWRRRGRNAEGAWQVLVGSVVQFS